MAADQMSSDKRTEANIRKLSLDKFAWKTTGQIDRVEDLFDDELVFTHITGLVTSKREWIAEMRSATFVYNEIEDKGASVKVEGDTATLVGRAVFTVTYGGGRGAFDIDFTEVYRLKGHQWKLVTLFTRLHR